MKKMVFLFLLLSGCAPLVLRAQYENVWAFGYQAGLDFNPGNPMPITSNFSGFGEAAAVVCDPSGTLLFYTEGTLVWDKNGNAMPNGSELTPVSGSGGISPTSSSAQGALIIPDPGDPYRYYIFSMTSSEQGIYAGRLYYSVVDIRLNGGLGDVVPGQKGILLDTGLTEKLTAITGDRCNVWLVTASSQLFAFKAFDITEEGIDTAAVLSTVGNGNSVSGLFGILAFSPDGRRLAATQFGGMNGATVYDFDRSSGLISNPLVLFPGLSNCYGICFSPDNSKVYANDILSDAIYQFDLSSNDPAMILNSKTWLTQVEYTHLKLGPDNKIYLRSSGSALGVINFPDLPGAACGYNPNGVRLLPGTAALSGLPNAVPVIRRDSFSSLQTIEAPCFSSSYTLRALNDSSGWHYVWNGGSSTGATLTVDTPGLYRVVHRFPPCYFKVDSFRLSFPAGVLPRIYTAAACNKQQNGKAWAATYPGDTVAYRYSWTTPSGDTLSLDDTLREAAAGAYLLHIATGTCDTVLRFLVPGETYRAAFETDTVVCQGESLHIANTSDDYFTDFRWDFGDGKRSSARNPGPDYQRPGSYALRLIASAGSCRDTVQRIIQVDSAGGTGFSLSPRALCVGQFVVLLPRPDATAISYDWDFGDGYQMSSPVESRVQHAFDSAGNKIVQLRTEFRACPYATFTDTVVVHALPVVDLGADAAICLNGAALFLKNLAAPPDVPYRSLWSTGDTGAVIRVTHPGIYSLTLQNEPLGCSNTESVIITESCYIEVPNAFTPDGDAINDFFFPRQSHGGRLTAFSMRIFNRWGQCVFETSRPEGSGWDGRFNGRPQPAGVYLYRIEAEMDGGIREKYEGNVTLIR